MGRPRQSRSRAEPEQSRSDGLLLPSSVGEAALTDKKKWDSNRFFCCCFYRGGRRQGDLDRGGLELVEGVAALVRAVVGLHRLDLHQELAGLVLVLRVAGRVEGVLLGMCGQS